MRMHDKCLPCVVNQVIKVADITGTNKKEELLRKVFAYLSKIDFKVTTPEIIGEIFDMIKKYTDNPDPYKKIRNYYNTLFLKLLPEFEKKIDQAEDSFQLAVRYAIVGNIIDFNPIHNTLLKDIFDYFKKMEHLELTIDDSKTLMKDISNAKILLYLGDNCGEICMDKILLKKIKEINSNIKIFFGVRGKPVINDSITEDAYAVGIDEYADVIDNGDGSLGTVINRASNEFKKIYKKADVVIAKGQANYECLSEENKNIYFLLMTKCDVIANDIGVEEKKMICMKINKSKVEKVNFYSDILGKEMSMLVYLPQCYNSLAPMPVLYFLHGRSGNENIMFEIGINTIADQMVNDKKIKPMIIVCPRIENSRGLNSSLICKEVSGLGNNNRIINVGMYEDYFIKEVIPLTDKTFNTIKDRKGRYIGGISSGGYIALHNTFRHQDMFIKVGGHMPALELQLEDEDKPYFKDMSMWEKYDPIHIAKNNNIPSDIDVYLDAGDKDEGRFYEGCSILHKVLKEKGINSQNHIFPGHHNGEYIQSNIEKYLKFYGN